MLNENMVNILKSLLTIKQQKKIEIEESQIINNSLFRLSHIIKNILSDTFRLKKVNLDSLDFKTLEINEEELNELKIYQLIIKHQLVLDSVQSERINQLFNKYKEKLSELNKKYNYDSNEYIGICLEILFLNDIIEKLQDSNISLTSAEIKNLGEYLKNNLDIEKAIDIISEYAYNMTLAYEEINELENEIAETIDSSSSLTNLNDDSEKGIQSSDLNKEEVINLFNEFGIDFNLIVEDKVNKYQTEICKYGDMNNIREILQILKKYNIDINNELLEERSGSLAKIFTLSNSELVGNILEFIVEDLKRNNDYNNDTIYKINKSFRIYLKLPSFFVKGNFKYSKSVQEKTELVFHGNYQNFEQMRKFLIEIGVKDFHKLLESCSDLFTRGYRMVVSNYKKLLSYGVLTEKILEGASCLRESDAIDIFDQFIEAGFAEYIYNCTSAVQFKKNSKKLIQMINAKKLGWNNIGSLGEEAIFRKQNKGTTTRLVRQDKMLLSLKSDNLIGEPIYEPDFPELPIDLKNIYGIDSNIFENEYIKRLEETFKTSEITYHFNEIIISRYKVLRYFGYLIKNELGTFENLKRIIFKDKILNKTEYDVVSSLLEEKIKNVGEQL